MSRPSKALRAVTAAALTGGFAVVGAATGVADPADPGSAGSTGSTDDLNTLAQSLSKGYDRTNCTAQQLTEQGELAQLLCGQSPDANGPATALYTLFDNGTDLALSFTSKTKTMSMAVCGDAGESPTIWRLGSVGATAGRVACGSDRNIATMIWTTDSANVLSHITASNGDLDTLYQWWRTKG